MTLWVTRDDQDVTVHGNVNLDVQVKDSRVSEWAVTEHFMHLRHFWGQLGTALDEAEQAATAATAQDG